MLEAKPLTFVEGIGTVWNGVRPALRCWHITYLCMLSFLLKDFSQTEQNQLMSTPHEQNVDWEKGRMLRIYKGLLLHHHHISIVFHHLSPPHFYCFLLAPPHFYFFPPPPPPPLFYHFYHHHISVFSSKSFYKRREITIISSVCSDVSSSEEKPRFSSTVHCFRGTQRKFLLKALDTSFRLFNVLLDL